MISTVRSGPVWDSIQAVVRRDIKPRTAPLRLLFTNYLLTTTTLPNLYQPPKQTLSKCLAAELLVALAPIAAALRVPATAANVSHS